MTFSRTSTKIVSGGQTGADRAALDFAIAHGYPHGGWCPKGRRAADGPLAHVYELRETDSKGYRQRTRRNVQDSDGTLIINTGELTGGSLATLQFAERFDKPVLVVQADTGDIAEHARAAIGWLQQHDIRVLNIAGPSMEKRPEIYGLLIDLLQAMDRQVLIADQDNIQNRIPRSS